MIQIYRLVDDLVIRTMTSKKVAIKSIKTFKPCENSLFVIESVTLEI